MSMTREQYLQMQASGRVYQERYDNALQPWDQRAPAPTLGEDIDTYRRNTLIKIKKLLPEGHQLRQIQIRSLRNDALDVFEPQLLKAARSTAYDADSVPPGEMRRIVEIDGNGLKIVKFVGQRSFVHDFTRAGRRVTSFLTQYGRVNASGQPVR